MEHAGGTPTIGFDTDSHASFPVAIQDFDYDAIDGCEPQPEERDRAAYAVKHLLTIIIQSPNPGMKAHQIAWATGLTVVDAEQLGDLCNRYGVSKQAFHQGARLAVAHLELTSQLRPRITSNSPRRQSVICAASFSLWLVKAVRWINTRLVELPLDQWPKARRDWLLRELRPIVELHDRLSG